MADPIPVAIELTAFNEYLSILVVDPSYLTVGGSAEYSSLTTSPGNFTVLETVADTEIVGAGTEFLDIDASTSVFAQVVTGVESSQINTPIEVVTVGAVCVAAGDGDVAAAVYTTAAQVNADRVVYYNEDGEVAHADQSNPDHVERVLGVATQAGAIGGSVEVVTTGTVASDSWGWTLGAPLFLGTDGFLTETPPVTGGLLTVAVAITATTILLQDSEPIFR